MSSNSTYVHRVEVMSLYEKPLEVKTPNIWGSKFEESPNCLQTL